MKCMEGIRIHNVEAMKACGLGDKYETKTCPKSKRCTVVDFWIQGINEKPLSLYWCGEESKTVTPEDEKMCKAICDRKEIDKSIPMLEGLDKMAVDKKKFTEECRKKFTKITNATKAHCKEEKEEDEKKQGCNVEYCDKNNFNDAYKKCNKKSPSTKKPGNDSTPGNATTNGGTKLITDLSGPLSLVLTLFINTSLGVLILIMLFT